MLKDRIKNKESGFLFYGLTPPKSSTDEAKIQEIANKQIERIKGLDIDGLVLYDIQDETSRNPSPRPFSFMATLSPDEYSSKFLNKLDVPKIIYKSVGKYTVDEFKNWISNNSKLVDYSVFVGMPTKKQNSKISLSDAYRIKQELNSSILIGGVTIPERHHKKKNEHLRVLDKIDKGCSFFISQCIYNINNIKDFLSDYYYKSIEINRELYPIIFTLTPCGSRKTLNFMEWLGIDIPDWLRSDLDHSKDILSKSVDTCKAIAADLSSYCLEKQIPFGFNIESVAIRKEEILASIELLKSIKVQMST